MTQATARDKALRWLARREYARAELVLRLQNSGYAPEEAQAAADGLAADGLQSDQRFAEVFVRSRHAQGQGPFRIRVELERRGIDEGDIHRHLQSEDYDWCAAADRAARKRFGDTPPENRREESRIYQFLARRGFEPDQIQFATTAMKRPRP